MTDAEKIREMAASGIKSADISRLLGVTRQAVWNALQRGPHRGRPSEGKSARVALRITAELSGAIEKARRPDETQSACVVRLIERGLRR